jgi:colanic acid biosynthesis glycosyl transferase WcaI
MFKILLFQQHYFPEMAGCARRAQELSEQLVKNEYSVTVITTFPREFRSVPGYAASKYEVLNNVKVIRLKTIFTVGKNPLFRMLSYLNYVISSFVFISRHKSKYNILISIAPLPSAISAALAQKFYKIFHHFDVPDILPDLGISAGMIKNKLVIKLLYKLEKWVYDHSSSISAITDGQINNIHNKGVSRKKLNYIPDWVDNTFFKENLKLYKPEVIQSLGHINKKIISFIGNIGALQNPNIFLQTMIALDKEQYNEHQFLFIGDGIMLNDLKKMAEEQKLNNVKFVGRIKRELVPAYMDLSDILVANYLPNLYMDICVPLKLYEYAISGSPIVMGARGEAKNLIEKYDLGITVAPSDVTAFKEAIIKISNGKYVFKPKVEQFLEDFSLQNVSKLYDQVIRQGQ